MWNLGISIQISQKLDKIFYKDIHKSNGLSIRTHNHNDLSQNNPHTSEKKNGDHTFHKLQF